MRTFYSYIYTKRFSHLQNCSPFFVVRSFRCSPGDKIIVLILVFLKIIQNADIRFQGRKMYPCTKMITKTTRLLSDRALFY